MKLRDPKALATTAASALVLLVAALLVQHFQHGWPFSLHHGYGRPAEPALAKPAAPSAHEQPAPSHPRAEVELTPSQLETIGARIERVREETIAEPIRAVATVVPDESRVSHVHTRVAGWIERLDITTTGERVRAGQTLAGIFSQELMSTQMEYVTARRSASGGPRSAVVEAARARLHVLGMSDAEISAIEQTGEPRRLVTLLAPRAGVVVHRGVSVGTAVDPSTEIITVADLSRVWVFAEVPEGDIPRIQVGTPARLEFPASGLPPSEAAVELLYPTLSERTRTLRVRFSVANPSGSLRPGIYGNAVFRVAPRRALTVPRDAVVDTGNAQHVFVVSQAGRFVPRTVKLGTRFEERVEVLDGLAAGESIVASGVFLVDSESRLRASGGTGHVHGGAHEAHNAPAPPKPTPPRPAAAPRRAAPPNPPAVSEHQEQSHQEHSHQGH